METPLDENLCRHQEKLDVGPWTKPVPNDEILVERVEKFL